MWTSSRYCITITLTASQPFFTRIQTLPSTLNRNLTQFAAYNLNPCFCWSRNTIHTKPFQCYESCVWCYHPYESYHWSCYGVCCAVRCLRNTPHKGDDELGFPFRRGYMFRSDIITINVLYFIRCVSRERVTPAPPHIQWHFKFKRARVRLGNRAWRAFAFAIFCDF